jgi:hypothetical protein
MTLRPDLRDPETGATVPEYLEMVASELAIDAVGLWQIIPAGRSQFGLSGDDLTEYVREAIFALISHGGVPVRGWSDGSGGAGWETIYLGDDPQSIAEKAIAEWHASGVDPPAYDSIWFATPGFLAS